MKYRKLRIAWSVFFGILCLSLIAFWARSYYYDFQLTRSGGGSLLFFSASDGQVHWTRLPSRSFGPATWSSSFGRTQRFGPFIIETDPVPPGFYLRRYSAGFSLGFPVWFVVALTAALAAAPWLRWRFSLRTLLIVMTLVAVGLGVIVWAVR